jgi:hypothetical protein
MKVSCEQNQRHRRTEGESDDDPDKEYKDAMKTHDVGHFI